MAGGRRYFDGGNRCVPLPPRAALALDASVLAGAGDSVDSDVSASWITEGHFRDHHLDTRMPVRRTLDRPGELEPGNDRQRPR